MSNRIISFFFISICIIEGFFCGHIQLFEFVFVREKLVPWIHSKKNCALGLAIFGKKRCTS